MGFRNRLAAFLLLRICTATAEPAVRSPQGPEVVVIGAYIRAHMTGIDECYGHRLNVNGHLRGKLILRFDIAPEGEVDNVTVEGMSDRPLLDCVLEQAHGWRFEKPAATLRVAYPLSFQPF